MEKASREKIRAGRLPAALGILGMGAGGVVALSPGGSWLSPGGLGEAGAIEVTDGTSASAYRSVTGWTADAPSWLGPFLEVATEGTLVILGLLLAWVGWTALRRGSARGVAGAMLTGLGTVVAYAISEAVKLVVDEERPCRALPLTADVIAECPAAGDWSFPSNHAALAAGLAVGLALLRPRLAAVTLPLAGAAALLRVLVGVHYPHDVLAGAVLGGTVVAAVLLAFMPLAQRSASALGLRASRPGSLRRKDSGFMGHHSGSGPVVHTEPRQDGTHMGLDRSLHHMQPPGDLPVGQPAAEEGQHVPLPGGESGDPVPGGGAPAGQGARARHGEVHDDPGRDLR